MRSLKTPPTLRLPELNEVPQNMGFSDRLDKAKNANVVEGFTINDNLSNPLPFEFYAEINIDNNKLWDVFISLLNDFPDEVSFIFCAADHEETPFYGKYMNKNFVLEKISKYKLELTQDCFFAFGIIHQTKDFLKEIFVDSTKYIKYWGVNKNSFIELLNNFNLKEIENLQFVNEFPKVREALSLHYNDTLSTEQLIDEFINVFDAKE